MNEQKELKIKNYLYQIITGVIDKPFNELSDKDLKENAIRNLVEDMFEFIDDNVSEVPKKKLPPTVT